MIAINVHKCTLTYVLILHSFRFVEIVGREVLVTTAILTHAKKKEL